MKHLPYLFIGVLLPGLLVLAQPWQPVVLWDQVGATTQSHFGSTVFALGDQNNDGYADWGVNSEGFGGFDSLYRRVDLYHGGNPPSATPYHSFIGGQGIGQEALWGQSAGDVNGDGYTDWIILKRYWPAAQVIIYELYVGGPAGGTEPLLMFPRPLHDFGFDLMGDFNGDGFGDLFNGHGSSGDVYFGSTSPDTVADWHINQTAQYPYLAAAYSYGDLNGDGYSDFVGTDPNRDYLHAIFGGNPPDTLPDIVWENFLEYTPQIVPDLNGDGYDDLLTEAFNAPYINVRLGRTVLQQTPDTQLRVPGGHQIDWIQGIGDVNADGFQDCAIVSMLEANWGMAAFYLGGTWITPDPVLELEGRMPPLGLVGIRDLLGIGDVNGDGVDDFAVGATNDDFDGTRGRVVVIAGNPDIHVASNERPAVVHDFHVQVYPNPFNSAATITLEAPPQLHAATLTVFNLLGQPVFHTTISASAGHARYAYDAEGLASGIYLLRVEAGSLSSIHKLMLLK